MMWFFLALVAVTVVLLLSTFFFRKSPPIYLSPEEQETLVNAFAKTKLKVYITTDFKSFYIPAGRRREKYFITIQEPRTIKVNKELASNVFLTDAKTCVLPKHYMLTAVDGSSIEHEGYFLNLSDIPQFLEEELTFGYPDRRDCWAKHNIYRLTKP